MSDVKKTVRTAPGHDRFHPYLTIALVMSLLALAFGMVTWRARAIDSAKTIAQMEDAADAAKALAKKKQSEIDGLKQQVIDAENETSALEADIESLTAELMTTKKRAERAEARVKRLESRRPNLIETASGSTGWRTARASWYGSAFYGHTMAGGGTYGPNVMGVAHKSLPFGTKVTISYAGKTVTVPVVDRGPYTPGREFDLTSATARALGFSGVQTIRWRVS